MISIIMPAFKLNRHRSLFEKAIAGIVAQSHKNWELLIICDGGDPEDIRLAKEVTLGLNGVRIFASEKQNGPEVTRNLATAYANGDSFIFHDSDDFSVPKRFDKLSSIMNGGVAASTIKINYSYQNTIPHSRIKKYPGKTLDLLINHGKVRTPAHLPSIIISADLFRKIGGFANYKFGADAIFITVVGYIRELTGQGPIPLYDEPIFEWNRHSFSVTTLAENSEEFTEMLEEQQLQLQRFRTKYIRESKKQNPNLKYIINSLQLKDNLKYTDDIVFVELK